MIADSTDEVICCELMSKSSLPIPLDYTALHRPTLKGLLAVALLFCAGCPLAWFISVDLALMGPSPDWKFFPFQFWMAMGLSILFPLAAFIQARVLSRREPWAARCVTFVHWGVAVLAVWAFFSFVHLGFLGSGRDVLQGLCLFIFGLEMVSGLLHLKWARTLSEEKKLSMNDETPASPPSLRRCSPWALWWRLPGWVRWPLIVIGFVGIGYLEFFIFVISYLYLIP
jgi:hypothetical protein